ncbi:MAG: hypothetical protein CVU09_04485 [Bacteroidetes bacterium HGW-Bacteroidetes-4]|jgi:hypothetical protein|nr:MAG: hypothetical protein CVU09_04485 [Bacteroidetes bacterium HGW-Bacteroidetes-4]
MKKYLLTASFWLLALLITLSAAIYQRVTGPTYPKKISLNDGTQNYALKLTRSAESTGDLHLEFSLPDSAIYAFLEYRRFPTNESWQKDSLVRKGELLVGMLPMQPPAGKIEYKLTFYKAGKTLTPSEPMHVIVRFKGAVPTNILIPHVIAIFLAMLLANFSALLALARKNSARLYAFITLGMLTLGGMIFGPLVQLHAFGELWTGAPFGWDLTDNKTLIAFIFWIIAVYKNRNQVNFKSIIVAALITLIIFSIPHSMFGSELNHETGIITQG